MLKLSNLLEQELVPVSGWDKLYNGRWIGQDNEARYNKNVGHPRYGPDDIAYSLNSRGYRCPEFDKANTVRTIALGCSWTFGLGIPKQDIYHELVAERLSAEIQAPIRHWNLGVSGGSNDLIARMLHLVLPILDPHFVMILFTYPQRREYIAADDQRINLNAGMNRKDPVVNEIARAFDTLASKHDDTLNLFRSYKAVEARLSDRDWAFSFIKPEHGALISSHVDFRRQALPQDQVDTARDHSHPGKLSHQLLFESFWATLQRDRVPDRLRAHRI